jgi:hypothetical protein
VVEFTPALEFTFSSQLAALYNRHNKVIPSYKPERYNIIEVNDYAD